MDHRVNAEKNRIISELNEICRELEQVAADLRVFKGIGAEHCSTKLHKLSNKYREIKGQVSRL